MDMTVGQLRTLLEDYEEDLPIRFAEQPSYPLQYHLEDLRLFRGVLYLREGGQVYDNPYLPRSVFTEDAEPCTNCGSASTVGTVRPDPRRSDREEICRECLGSCPTEVFETYDGPLREEDLTALEADRSANLEVAAIDGSLAMEDLLSAAASGTGSAEATATPATPSVLPPAAPEEVPTNIAESTQKS